MLNNVKAEQRIEIILIFVMLGRARNTLFHVKQSYIIDVTINGITTPSVAYFKDGYLQNFCVTVVEDVSETPGVIEPFKYERHFTRSREMRNYFNKMCTKFYVIACCSCDCSKSAHNLFNDKTYKNEKYKDYDTSKFLGF